MVALKSECLSENDLRAVLSGKLEREKFDSAISHIDDCDTCRRTAEQIQTDGDWIAGYLRGDHDDPLQAETACQVALWRMLQTPAESGPVLAEPVPFKELGPYRLTESLGIGGMGTVYLAEHARLKRQCAIKILPKERVTQAGWLERFDREMTTVAALEHPNIVRASDAGHEDGWHYLVMEYLDGMDVGRIASRLGKLDAADACEVVRQAALGLSHIHDSGLVHRDIKPSNLMLTRRETVKLLDLGLVLSGDDPLGVDDRLTTVGHLMGTIPFMAPEQLSDSRDVDPKADIYSLGATLFRLVAGRPPHQRLRGLAAHILQITSSDAPSLDAVCEDTNADLSELLSQMLSRDPAVRPNASEVANRLRPLASGSRLKGLLREALRRPDTADESVLSLLPSATTEPAQSKRGWKWLAAGFCAAAIVIAGIVFKIQTDVGDLVVHSEQDGLQVVITRDDEVIRELVVDSSKKNETSLKKGTYRVRIEGGGEALKLSDEVVTISRGGKTEVSIAKTQQRPLEPSKKRPEPRFQNKKLSEWMAVLESTHDLDQLGEAMSAVMEMTSSYHLDRQSMLAAILKRAREYGGLAAKTPTFLLMTESDATDSHQFMFYLKDAMLANDHYRFDKAIAEELVSGNGRSRAACLFLLRGNDWFDIHQANDQVEGRLLLNQFLRNLVNLISESNPSVAFGGLSEQEQTAAKIEAYEYALRIAMAREIDPLSIAPLKRIFDSRKPQEMSVAECVIKAVSTADTSDVSLAYEKLGSGNDLGELYHGLLSRIPDDPKKMPDEDRPAESVSQSDGVPGPAANEHSVASEEWVVGTKPVEPSASASNEDLLFKGSNLQSWMRLLEREQDPESLGDILRAVSVLSKDVEGKQAAAIATIKLARKLGGLTSSHTHGFGIGGYDPASLQYMEDLLEFFPKYLPEPGLEVLANELKEGTPKSQMATLWLISNFLSGIVGDTTYSELTKTNQEHLKKLAAENSTLIDALLSNLECSCEQFQKTDSVPTNTAVATSQYCALRLKLILGESIVGDSWLEDYVDLHCELAKAHKDASDPVFTAGQSSWVDTPVYGFRTSHGFGTTTNALPEEMLIAAAELAEHRKADAQWDFLLANTLKINAYRSPECKPVLEKLIKHKPNELWREIDSQLLLYMVPLFNENPGVVSGDAAVAGGMDMMGGGGMGGGPPASYAELTRPHTLWPDLIQFHAQYSKKPKESLAVIEKLRKANAELKLDPAVFKLDALDSAIEILKKRSK